MRRIRFVAFMLIIAVAVQFTAGCATVSFSTLRQVSEHNIVVDVARYFGEPMLGSHMYVRTNLKDKNDLPALYERRESEDRRMEGRMCRISAKSIAGYLYPPRIKNRVVRFPWPDKRKPTGPAFFINFDPPVAEWPMRLQGQSVSTVKADMNVYDRAGNHFAQGTATRRVRAVSYDTIEVGGVVYQDCAQLESEISMQFGWWATVRIFEQLWVNADQGLLRRTERLHGVALLLFKFDSHFQYDLVSEAKPGKSSGEDNVVTGAITEPGLNLPSDVNSERSLPLWENLAIYLDRDVPHPRVGGMFIEFVSSK